MNIRMIIIEKKVRRKRRRKRRGEGERENEEKEKEKVCMESWSGRSLSDGKES